MELEFHQLELRYERLRVQQPARERRLLASLAMAGQQMPIVVVTGGSAYVVVDGHKRVRCLRRLQRDTIAAVVWEMPEPEALIFRQLLCADATDSAPASTRAPFSPSVVTMEGASVFRRPPKRSSKNARASALQNSRSKPWIAASSSGTFPPSTKVDRDPARAKGVRYPA